MIAFDGQGETITDLLVGLQRFVLDIRAAGGEQERGGSVFMLLLAAN